MSEDKRQMSVRIVVKKKHGGGHHGGAWKVAYADFVTAMMALFIVLWIVGQNSGTKQAIAAYFKDPTILAGGSGIHAGQSQSPPAPVLFPKPGATDTSMVLQAIQTQAALINREMEKLKTESIKIEKIISSVPAFEKFKDKIKISVSKDGMKIELIENSQGLFFDVGSAKVKPETIRLLKLLAEEIRKLPNQVIIEGHTDARPYITPGYSNWELSTERANSARKLLGENGLRKDQIREVRGYADRFLKHPDKPLDFANRRVNIIVAIPQQSDDNKSTAGKTSQQAK
ncbi:MAG: OmpA family protein [Proteobacteria bacterium]|nr:OmpA family protein [Pseudomonadota bacterium]